MPSTKSVLVAALVPLVSAAPTAKLSFGTLNGNSRTGQTCDEFLGIPFAEAPVGELRFAAPKPWSQKYPAAGRDATEHGSICLQELGVTLGSEDCLFLNVWKPTSVEDELLPIMAWIHGGSFQQGAGSMYDGCQLTSKGVVVASMNYRMGPFGYSLFDDGETVKSNFGMKDQRQALAFLRQEAAAFGGDASKLTIFGESAGAISVMYHLASPLSAGLFRGAISESGFPAAWGFDYAKNVTATVAAAVGCTGNASSLRSCLRDVDAKTLLKNSGEGGNPFTTAGWSPSVDLDDMPEYPFALYAKRQVNKVPVMAGFNTNEGNLFVWPFYPTGLYRESVYKSLIESFINSHDPTGFFNDTELAELFDLYPTPSALKDKRPVAGQLLTDGTFLCGTESTAWDFDVADFYLYRFNHRSSCIPGLLPGVFHGMEISYVFGNTFGCNPTDEEKALSERMQTRWTNFAKNLNPSIEGEDAFPKYTSASKKGLVLQTLEDAIEEGYRSDFCKFWKRASYDKYAHADARHEPVIVV